MGMAKAPVLPDPVSASPIISRPEMQICGLNLFILSIFQVLYSHFNFPKVLYTPLIL